MLAVDVEKTFGDFALAASFKTAGAFPSHAEAIEYQSGPSWVGTPPGR